MLANGRKFLFKIVLTILAATGIMVLIVTEVVSWVHYISGLLERQAILADPFTLTTVHYSETLISPFPEPKRGKKDKLRESRTKTTRGSVFFSLMFLL